MSETRTRFATLSTLLTDPVLRLVLFTRAVTVVSAPVTLFLIAALRPPDEQGFYFVFTNAQAIAVLFEYGVGAMLVQFAAHSSAGFDLSAKPASGEVIVSDSVSATLAAARRWFGAAALVVLAVILPLGFFLFKAESASGVSYATPWVVLIVSLGCYLALIPFICVLEGTGHLRRVQQMRLVQALVTTACLWALIPLVGGLEAIAVATVASFAVAGGWLVISFPTLLGHVPGIGGLRSREPAAHITIATAQSRTAATWIVAFIGPQLLSPIVFRFQGAAAAGQIGLSLAAASAPLMVAVSWLQARYPEYGSLAARNQLAQLDAMAAKATVQAVVVFCIGSLALIGLLVAIQEPFPRIAARFLSVGGVASLSLASLASLLYQAMAGHLRAHREESLLWPVVGGILAAVVATLIGARHGLTMAAVAYSGAVTGILLPWSIVVFIRRRRVLHAHDAPSERGTR